MSRFMRLGCRHRSPLADDAAAVPAVAYGASAFTLVEVLVGLTVFVVALVASILVFSNAIKNVRNTGTQSDANAAIDSDIARIKQLAEIYNACADPAGSLTACTGMWPDGTTSIKLGDAWYYYPDPSNAQDVVDFDAACRATSSTAHITRNLIVAINALSQPALTGVVRATAVRESPTDPKNHLILIQYTASGQNIDRLVKILPVVSAWCP